MKLNYFLNTEVHSFCLSQKVRLAYIPHIIVKQQKHKRFVT